MTTLEEKRAEWMRQKRINPSTPNVHRLLPDHLLTPRELLFRDRARRGAAHPNSVARRSPEWKASQAAKLKEFRDQGNKTRAGVPRGWLPKVYHTYRALLHGEAAVELQEMIPHMTEEFQAIVKDDDMAREAMTQTLMVMKDKSTRPETKLQAARTILEWTKQKPATKNEHTVRRAEDFLAELAAKDSDGPVIIEHQEAPSGRLPILRGERATDQDEEGHNRQASAEPGAASSSGDD